MTKDYDAAAHVDEAEVGILVASLGQIAGELGSALDRAAIHRATVEAARTWAGPLEERWWKWLIEAGVGLELRASLLESPAAQLVQWANEGLHLVVDLTAEPDRWVVVCPPIRGKYELFFPGTGTQRKVRRGKLRRLLQQAAGDGVLRAVAVEPAETCGPGAHAPDLQPGHEMSPLSRLLVILRAEWSDIWVLMVFTLVSGMLALATPMAVQVMVSLVAFGRFLQPVIVLSLLLAALMAFWAALRLWETYIGEILQRRLFARVVHDLSYRFPRVRQDSMQGEYGPELANRFFDVVTLQKVTVQLLVDALDLVIVVVVGMVVLAVYHPVLLGLDVLLLVALAFIIFVLGRGGIRTSIQESKYKYRTAAWLEELMRCPLTFRLDNAGEFGINRAEQLVSGYLESRRLHFRILFRQIAAALAIHAAVGSVVLGVGGWLVILGQLTLGQLVAAELIVSVIVGSFAKLGKHLKAFYDLMAGIDKLGVLFDLPMEPQRGLMRLPEVSPAELRVEGLSLHMGSRELIAVRSLAILPGERVALTGPSGAGKSVLANLLYGTLSPSRGRILLDEHELTEVRPDVWRRHVMLLRDPEIFHGTLTENVHMENPDIDPRLVREACEQLKIMQSAGLVNGLQTVLSPTGAPLTGSQIRSVCLARALVHRPRLLIIDGLLDGLPDDLLEPALGALFDEDAPWSLLMISSDPRVVSRCDRAFSLPAPGVST